MPMPVAPMAGAGAVPSSKPGVVSKVIIMEPAAGDQLIVKRARTADLFPLSWNISLALSRGGVPMFFVKLPQDFSSKCGDVYFGQQPVTDGVVGRRLRREFLGGLGCGHLVKRSVAQHREQHVAAASCEGDQGLVVPFALGSFAVVVGPGDGVFQGRER